MSGAATESHVTIGTTHRRAWPIDGLERVLTCPVCGSSHRSPIHTALTDEVFFCAPGSWDMQRCQACNSCYLDPRPTPQTIHLAYGSYFTHADADEVEPQASQRGLRKVRRALANGYRNWRYGTRAQPASRLGLVAALLVPRLRLVADAGMRFIPRYAEGRRLLDVGAGNGTYLLRARSAGWEVLGVEPDASAVNAALRAGLNVRQGGITDLTDEQESLDVITLNHVIEHVHDPRATLRKAFELLRSGGLLYIETPCITSYGHKRFGRHWRGLEPPRHLVLFTWSALESLLLEVGFRRIKRLRRPGIYPTLARKSRAIQDGRDPEAPAMTSILTKTVDELRGSRAIFDHRTAEFITLFAEKG